MSITLIVNNSPYLYPVTGDEPGWGEGATGWAEEVTDVLNSLLTSDDILQTTFSVNNLVTTDTNIVGLTFNTGTVRAAFVNYSIYRVSDINPSGHAEAGIMTLVYDNSAAALSKWSISVGSISGSAGVTFSITDAGQVQYKSTDIGTTNYVGTMKFNASSLQQ